MDHARLVEAFLRRRDERRLRRREAELWKFAEALDRWLNGLLEHPRADWREQWEIFLAEQEAEGRIVLPESRQSIVDYLTAWAAAIGLKSADAESRAGAGHTRDAESQRSAGGYPEMFGPQAALVEEEIRSRGPAQPLVPELPPAPDWKPRIVEIRQLKGYWGHYDELVATGRYDPGSLERAFRGFVRTILPASQPSTRITFDDGSVLILLGGGPDSGALAGQAAFLLGARGAVSGATTVRQAVAGLFSHLSRETAEAAADSVIQELTGLPVGPSLLGKPRKLPPRISNNRITGRAGLIQHRVTAPDVRTLRPVPDPKRPVYKRGHAGQIVEDHVLSREIARQQGRLPEALDSSNIRLKPMEMNSRKGGYEAAYLRQRRMLIDGGMTPEEADAVMEETLRWIINDALPRPMDPRVLDRIPAPGSK